jgi:hypothetical protein
LFWEEKLDSQDLKNFYEEHSISIRKFLMDNFDGDFKVGRKDNGRKWRIKHSEIEILPYVVPISIKFAIRYVELVERGYIIIVRDEFGKSQVYLNPRMLKNIALKPFLENELKELEKPFNDLTQVGHIYEKKMYIYTKIEEINEIERIMHHFRGDETLEYTNSLGNAMKKVKS